jgi:alpha-mannosidase
MDIKGDAVIQTVKMSMDKTGVVIRMYNRQKQDETVTLTFDRIIKKAEVTDILENYIEDISTNGNDCTFTLGGGAQKTVKIFF